jgi:hypothetical protein
MRPPKAAGWLRGEDAGLQGEAAGLHGWPPPMGGAVGGGTAAVEVVPTVSAASQATGPRGAPGALAVSGSGGHQASIP